MLKEKGGWWWGEAFNRRVWSHGVLQEDEVPAAVVPEGQVKHVLVLAVPILNIHVGADVAPDDARALQPHGLLC